MQFIGKYLNTSNTNMYHIYILKGTNGENTLDLQLYIAAPKLQSQIKNEFLRESLFDIREILLQI